MSVGTGVSTYGGPIVNNPLNIYSLLKEVASHQICYQNSLWSRLVLDMLFGQKSIGRCYLLNVPQLD